MKAALSDVLGWVGSGELDADPRLPAEVSENYDTLARLVARVFGSEDGRAVLELLADITIRRAPADHRLTGADYTAYAELRKGQNQVFAAIGQYLNRARELETPPHEHRNPSVPDGQSQRPGPGSGSDAERGWSEFDRIGGVGLR